MIQDSRRGAAYIPLSLSVLCCVRAGVVIRFPVVRFQISECCIVVVEDAGLHCTIGPQQRLCVDDAIRLSQA